MNWMRTTNVLPDEGETVWLYNENDGFVTLGARFYPGTAEDGWLWAVTNGLIYSDNGKIVSECETDDDYEITHWHPVPELPNKL